MSKRTKAGRKRSFRNYLAPFVMAEMVRQSKVDWARAFPAERVYRLVMEGREDAALDVVFERLDDVLSDGDFAAVDRVLADVNLSGLTPTVALGYLTMAWPAHRRLVNFDALRERIRPWMAAQLGDAETDNLLRFPDVR